MNKPVTKIIVGVAAAVLLISLLLWWQGDEPEPPVSAVAPAAQTPAALEPALPSLEESDPLAWQEISQLAAAERIARWQGISYILQRGTAILTSAAEGRVERKQVEILGPDAPFPVLRRGHDLYLDPAGHRRFEPLAQLISGLDAESTVAAYRRLEPLMQKAYEQLGRQGPMHEAVREAIGRVLRAPLVEQDIMLLRKSVVYKYKDPALESLDAVARQMIRMGPDNTRTIQAKLREINELL